MNQFKHHEVKKEKEKKSYHYPAATKGIEIVSQKNGKTIEKNRVGRQNSLTGWVGRTVLKCVGVHACVCMVRL